MTALEFFHSLLEVSPQSRISPVCIPGLTRKGLMKVFGELGFAEGAEIGVDRGRFSKYMLDHIPGLHLLCIDSWTRRYRGTERIGHTRKRLEGYNCELIHKTSLQAVGDVKNRSLDFVYIDGDHHFDYVMTDIIVWSEKVKPGGIVAGHDYWEYGNFGIIDAVSAYTKAHNITEWFVTDEKKAPSYFWVVE